MEAGLQARGRRGLGPWFVVAAALLLILRAAPLVRGYFHKLSGQHPPGVLFAAAALASVAFAALWFGVWKRPRETAAAVAILATAMVVLSGNLAALAAAAVVLVGTLLIGDLVSRVFRGVEGGPGDLSSVLAAGLVAAGLLVLLLGEVHLLRRPALIGVLAVVAIARAKRMPVLFRLARETVRLPRGTAPPALEAAWLAFAGVVLLAVWAGVQGPDVSWDALAYHLPQAQDIALSGNVAARADLAPHSLLWRNHDAFLSLGFLFGGERAARFLQFAAGLAVFGAALSLARRLGAAGASALIVFALAAFPTAILQLRATYVDWPAALLVTASAAELADRRGEPGRMRLAGFLFGGALATKIFALFALPALAILVWRSRPRFSRVAAACGCALIALAPWAVWSERHTGSFLEPYARSPRELVDRLARGHYFATSPASGASRPQPSLGRSLLTLPRLPYDLVFHSSRFEANGDGYNGILILLLLVGVAGWGVRPIGLFLLALLPFLVPWSLLYLPSVRYLLPVYPLYAVFAAEGLRRLTRGFVGIPGRAAGLALLGAAAAFPVQLGSSGAEWRTAFGRMSREESLAARLPSLALLRRIGPDARVVFLGENDRFHCPASLVWRSEFQPVASWGSDPEVWGRELSRGRVTDLVYREDRMDARALLEGLGGRIEKVGQNGPAILYRVKS
jgi:hypothetical protein